MSVSVDLGTTHLPCLSHLPHFKSLVPSACGSGDFSSISFTSPTYEDFSSTSSISGDCLSTVQLLSFHAQSLLRNNLSIILDGFHAHWNIFQIGEMSTQGYWLLQNKTSIAKIQLSKVCQKGT